MSLRPSHWGLQSIPRLGTWGEQSQRRHCPGIQHSACERGLLHVRVSVPWSLPSFSSRPWTSPGQAQEQPCSSGTSTSLPSVPGAAPVGSAPSPCGPDRGASLRTECTSDFISVSLQFLERTRVSTLLPLRVLPAQGMGHHPGGPQESCEPLALPCSHSSQAFLSHLTREQEMLVCVSPSLLNSGDYVPSHCPPSGQVGHDLGARPPSTGGGFGHEAEAH